VLANELITDISALEALYAEWDALAVTSKLPLMSPAWQLAWWRHMAPQAALPRVVVVRDGARLVGLAPFFVQLAGHLSRVDYRLPGIDLAVRLAPLALPGREWQVAEAIGRALDRASPRPDLIALEGSPLASHWPVALRDSWPGPMRPIGRCYAVHSCPTVSLDAPSYEAWLATKSAHFRERMRRARRKFEAAGGSIRFSTLQTLKADVGTLVRLHTKRWESLGASKLVALGERTPAMFEDAGKALLEEGRFRLMVLEIEGEPISAHLALAAGGEVLGLNGGWDERWARLSPTVVGGLRFIEDAIARGDRRFDLGLGDQSYKRRLADGDDPVAWTIIMTPGRRLPVTAVRTAPLLARYAARDAAKRALTQAQVDSLRSLRQSVRARFG
jgi:CelD/BcsL family acetyltransferase involved in cellulose biosynthesis